MLAYNAMHLGCFFLFIFLDRRIKGRIVVIRKEVLPLKKKDLIKIILSHGGSFVRHGSDHDIYQNAQGNKKTQLPRHNEINEITAKKILKQLGIRP
nr:MAG TPA_asm: HICA protein [Caudoviricetes sp.]